MEENIRTQEEISLGDIFKILFKKIKVLILAVLIGAIVGGGLGVLRTFNVKYYGTSISFYVNPKKNSESVLNDSQYGVYGAYGRHVMDNMTKLLASESFAEKLMLDSEGLPLDGSTGDGYNLLPEGENRAVIDEKIAQTEEPIAQAKAATKVADALRADTAEKLKTYNDTKDDADKLAWEEAKQSQKDAEKIETDKWLIANEAVEAVRAEWRKTELYVEYIEKITEYTTYSYVEETNGEDVSDLAKSFIYVKISVLEDEGAFANFLFERINTVLPEYVQTNMAVPSGYVGTNCQRITRLDEVERTNEGYMLKTVIKYAILLAAATFVVACVAVIVIDRSNKRLRDYDLTFEKFGVPVLGIVPTIDEREYTAKTEQEQTTGVEK